VSSKRIHGGDCSAIAVALVPASAYVLVQAVPVFLSTNMDPVRISGIVLGDIVGLVCFSPFV